MANRQLAAIMFTDIAGYTALMDEDEQKAFELLKKNRLVQGPLIEKHHGKWLKEMGDGVLASFASVTDAVLCAAAIQKTCEDEPDLNLRIGIHQGEVVFDGEDVFGSGVNIASRLESLAPIGEILVSESVHLNLRNKKSITTTYLREELLKNVKEPIKIYTVKVEGVEPMVIPKSYDTTRKLSPKSGSYRKLGFASLVVIMAMVLAYLFYSRQIHDDSQPMQLEVIDKSIAVLPFRNDSPDSDNQYFADGMMDEILNHLQKIHELGVKSRTAVQPYRNSTLSFATIAQELKVAFVLEGAVRKYGDRFRVTTQLIEVATGNHLWSETYDGTFSDTIFIVQSNIAKKVAASLSAVITPDEEESIDRVPTTDIAAYDLYIRANHERLLYFQTHDQKNLKRSHDLLDEAIQIDPNYLKAILEKGATYMNEGNYDSAFVYIDRVLAIDPDFSAAYAIKGALYSHNGKLDLAIENYLKAIDLGGALWYHNALGIAYSMNNEFPKALPHFEKALESENDGFLGGVYMQIAISYLNLGYYEKVVEYYQKVAELNLCGSNGPIGEAFIAQGKFQKIRQIADSACQNADCERSCYRLSFHASLLLGEFEKAEKYYYQWQNLGRDRSFWQHRRNYEIGYVLYQLGRKEEAGKIFKEQIKRLESELDKEDRDTYLNLARIFAFRGEKKEALVYLKKYAEKGFIYGQHDFIMIDPFFESLRDDPEFKAIVRQAQEEKATLRAQVREMEARGELNL